MVAVWFYQLLVNTHQSIVFRNIRNVYFAYLT